MISSARGLTLQIDEFLSSKADSERTGDSDAEPGRAGAGPLDPSRPDPGRPDRAVTVKLSQTTDCGNNAWRAYSYQRYHLVMVRDSEGLEGHKFYLELEGLSDKFKLNCQ